MFNLYYDIIQYKSVMIFNGKFSKTKSMKYFWPIFSPLWILYVGYKYHCFILGFNVCCFEREREREREREIILLHLVFFPENNKSLQSMNVSKLSNHLISCVMWLPCVYYISVYFFFSHRSWNSCIFPIYFVCNSLSIYVYIYQSS